MGAAQQGQGSCMPGGDVTLTQADDRGAGSHLHPPLEQHSTPQQDNSRHPAEEGIAAGRSAGLAARCCPLCEAGRGHPCQQGRNPTPHDPDDGQMEIKCSTAVSLQQPPGSHDGF